jgi:hypothetical protein
VCHVCHEHVVDRSQYGVQQRAPRDQKCRNNRYNPNKVPCTTKTTLENHQTSTTPYIQHYATLTPDNTVP